MAETSRIAEDEFRAVLKRHLTPGRAISSPQYLRGRETKLRQIDRAFNSDGKHIFIHGDRGVGKTSLGRTAAFIHSSADGKPAIVECERTSTAFQLLRDVAIGCIPPVDLIHTTTTKRTLKGGAPILGGEIQEEIKRGQIPEMKTINEALAIISYVASLNQKRPVVVLDEFDVIEDEGARHTIASFLKHISDQEIDLRFIVCGIGGSLDEMIGAHLSTGRYLMPVPLERLPHDARWEIIHSTAVEIGVEVDFNSLVRIGQVSDGFPYYVHLIGEKLFWAIWDDEKPVSKTTPVHFEIALKEASIEAEPSLKKTYEKATIKYSTDYQKYTDTYQQVLWAVADDSSLRRHVRDLYGSYERLMRRHFRDQKPIELKTFNERLSALCSPEHGQILSAEGAGWYEFKENRLRGYVRLVAERAHIQLEPEHPLGEKMYKEFEEYLKRAAEMPAGPQKRTSNKF